MSTANLSIVVDGAIGLAVVAAGAVLLALGKIDAQTGIAVIAGGIAVAKGASSAALALRVPAPPQQVVTPSSSAPPSGE
jgi:hypothetical protein